MERQEKINFILEIIPNADRIIPFATDKQIDQLVEDAKYKLDHKLIEAATEYV